ncbi:DNA mismatch repair endonuclease MutL [Myxococcota bacterium]|nr:DNA mismatch repair endonuclease MutL [Myxococcota bacterium]
MLQTLPPSAQTGRIRVLPDALIDQIAAGEVVERPSSVVKELVENSLDAGARTIRVDVRDGGMALIAVQDDGFGMSPEELPVALARHATSKLRSVEDLMRIASFGFRGEALPAIASVSRLRILSRARGASAGHEILIESGKVLHSRTAGGPEGTRIEVADLFATIPARRKFLKRAGTEWGHIADWLARLAMVRPDIHLEIHRDDRPAMIWPACSDRRDRLALLLPEEDGASLIAVDLETAGVRVHGFTSTPEHSRATSQGLYLFVNGRPVRDRVLSHAMAEPYRDLLPRGRFPVGVLFVEVPPESVDVNVHPAKWEVRFSDPQAVHRAIRHALREAIASRRWLALAPAQSRAGTTPTLTPTLTPTMTPTRTPRSAPSPIDASSQSRGALNGGGDRETDRAAVLPLTVREGAGAPWRTTRSDGQAAGRSAELDDWSFARGASGLAAEPRDPMRADSSVAAGPDRPVASFAALRLIGQLRASYLLAEGERGLVVVDQHAAHERILYERLRQAWLEAGVARQGLLSPIVIPVSPAAIAAVEASAETVGRLGFDLEPFGDAALLLRAVPAELADSDPESLVRDLAAALIEGDPGGAAEASAVRWLPVLDRFFATLACHSARRFGDRLPDAEQRAILSGLDTIPWAPTCPHGRPVAVLLDEAELEARFRRR